MAIFNSQHVWFVVDVEIFFRNILIITYFMSDWKIKSVITSKSAEETLTSGSHRFQLK